MNGPMRNTMERYILENGTRIEKWEKTDLKPEVLSHDGTKLKLKAFHSWYDCEVEFPDGAVAEHICAGTYQFGNVMHPDFQALKPFAVKNTGDVVYAENGERYCIIDGERTDLTIMTGDGLVVYHRSLYQCRRGYFGTKRLGKVAESTIDDVKTSVHEGMTVTNKDGDTVTITKVLPKARTTSATRINAVVSHDGIRYYMFNETYTNFSAGKLTYKRALNKNPKNLDCLEIKTPLPASIRHGDHFYVLESENENRTVNILIDGVGKKRVPYKHYLKGKVKLGGWYDRGREILENTTGMSNSGYKMSITAYRTSQDIDVLLETLTGKEIAKHRTLGNFRDGKICSDLQRMLNDRQYEKKNKKERAALYARYLAKIGKTAVNVAGQRYGIIRIRKDGKADVIFEKTGEILEGQNWYAVSHGFVVDHTQDPDSVLDAMENQKPVNMEEFYNGVFGNFDAIHILAGEIAKNLSVEALTGDDAIDQIADAVMKRLMEREKIKAEA